MHTLQIPDVYLSAGCSSKGVGVGGGDGHGKTKERQIS